MDFPQKKKKAPPLLITSTVFFLFFPNLGHNYFLFISQYIPIPFSILLKYYSFTKYKFPKYPTYPDFFHKISTQSPIENKKKKEKRIKINVYIKIMYKKLVSYALKNTAACVGNIAATLEG